MSARSGRRRPLLAGHSWSFRHLDLAASCRHAAALGYDGLDLGSGELGAPAGLDVPAVVADAGFGERARQAAAAAGIVFTDYFAALSHEVNTAEAGRLAENETVFRALVPRLVDAGVPGVTFSPGFRGEHEPEAAIKQAAAGLRRLITVADGRLAVRIEPHVDSVADTPARTLALLAAAPGLTLTLDYSHFVVAGLGAEEIEPLHPFASHVHIRQARPGELAVEVARGTIDVRRLLGRLVSDGYGGAITVEYVSAPWQGQDRVDADVENAYMAAEVRAILAELTPSSEGQP